MILICCRHVGQFWLAVRIYLCLVLFSNKAGLSHVSVITSALNLSGFLSFIHFSIGVYIKHCTIYNRRQQSLEVLKELRRSDYLVLVEYLAVVKVSVGEYPVDAAAHRTQLSHR